MHDQVEMTTRKETGARLTSLPAVQRRVVVCRRCPRLVKWREAVAKEKARRFQGEEYWGKPIPSFGDPSARLLIVGLAPAAHGGNRTGRMFTGDESGNWLFRALHRAGFASQPESVHRYDGLRLTDCYITATLRCAPPKNKPTREEILRCQPFLDNEITLLRDVRVVVGLGKVGFDAALEAFRRGGKIDYARRPAFAHGATYHLGPCTFIASYHPSQQNTYTGRLTRPMLDSVFAGARQMVRSRQEGR
jgi:uracil-DNA glycosylase family 4